MDKIQKVLIKAGRKDLAQDYYLKIAGKVDDEKIAKKLHISLDQLNSLRKYKRDQSMTMKVPFDDKGKKIHFVYFTEKDGLIVYERPKLNERGRTVGRSSSSFDAKTFFDKVKAKIIKYEDSEVSINVDPTKADETKAAKIGSYKTEFYPGGFPSSSNITYTHKDEKKAKALLNRMKSREMIIRMTKAVKSVFGDNSYSGPYRMFMEKAKSLGCTEDELKSIENYNKHIDLKHNFKF